GQRQKLGWIEPSQPAHQGKALAAHESSEAVRDCRNRVRPPCRICGARATPPERSDAPSQRLGREKRAIGATESLTLMAVRGYRWSSRRRYRRCRGHPPDSFAKRVSSSACVDSTT